MGVRRVLAGLILGTALSGGAALASSPPSGPASTTEPAPGDPFPLTVVNALGEVEVPSAPERVVAIGSAELDTLLALGIVPVGYGTYDDELLPYQRDALGGHDEPEIFSLADGIPLETVARLDPDLIVSLSWTDESNYDALLDIAPVVAYVEEPWGDSWTTQTGQIASGIGRSTAGDALIAGVSADVADVAAAHPEFAGPTITFTAADTGSLCSVDLPDAPALVFMSDLGFTPALSDPDSVYCVELGPEEIAAIDADVVLLFGSDAARAELEANPLYETLDAVAGNRVVWLDDVQANAINSPTPLAIRYFLDTAVDDISTALS